MSTRIEEIVRQLPLRRKIAQMISSRVESNYSAIDDPVRQRTLDLVENLGIGGITFFQGSVPGQVMYTNLLQSEAAVPLLVAQDAENGLGMRLPDATTLPHMMAIGASGKPAHAYEACAVTAREANALGVHHVFAPVADVNNNPDNPIINIRSFGGDRDAVSDFVVAGVKGLQDHRVIATAKHFPGHGDTAVDTHLNLATLDFDRKRLDEIELSPFRAAIEAGVRSIMIGHLSVPQLDPSGLPASLSPAVVRGLLRDELGFEGLVVTDALDMNAITNTYGAAEAAVLAVEAGVDMLLLVADEYDAVDAIENAVLDNRIDEARIDGSVRRILHEKEWSGTLDRKEVRLVDVLENVATKTHADMARKIALDGVCRIDNHEDEKQLAGLQVTLLPVVDDPCSVHGVTLETELREAGISLTALPPVYSSSLANRSAGIEAAISQSDLTVVALFLSVRSYSGSISFPAELIAFINTLIGSHSVHLVCLGSPYIINVLDPEADLCLATCSSTAASEWAAAQVLLERSISHGTVPVELSDGMPPLSM